MGWQVKRGFVSAAGADAKYHEVGAAVYGLNTTGSITHLDIVPQGTTVLTRVGKSYQINTIQIRGYVQADSAATVNMVAMYLVWDNQPNKALAAINDVINGTNPYSFSRRENVARFTILKKWIRVLEGNNAAGGQTGKTTFVIDYYKKVKNRGLIAQCTSADTTGVIGNRINGALLLITVGDSIAGTSDANANLTMRLGFND